jgi:GT2 family glycosyltransferase
MAQPLSPSVGVVVVTWNARETVEACLASVPSTAAVTVIDNGSADGTADIVRRAAPSATVIANEDNRGFAVAVNQGIAAAGEVDFVLLLNPDATLAPGALDALVAFAQRQPDAGLVSALIVDEAGGTERFAGGVEPSVGAVAIHELGLRSIFPGRSLYRVPDDSAPTRFDWVAGTCVLARRSAIEDVGELDERYFLYCEDIDWCRRMREAGWEVWVEPGARVVHRRSASVNAAGDWVDEHRIGSLDRYFSARHGRASVLAFRSARVAGPGLRFPAFAAAGRVLRRPDLAAKAVQRRRDAATAARLLRRHH